MKQKNKEQNHNKKYIAIEILVGILVSLGIFLFLYLRGYQPAGEDVYGHLYKVEFLGENIKKGVLFPLYTEVQWISDVPLLADLCLLCDGDRLSADR